MEIFLFAFHPWFIRGFYLIGEIEFLKCSPSVMAGSFLAMPNLFEFLEERRPIAAVGLAFEPFFILQGLLNRLLARAGNAGKKRAQWHNLREQFRVLLGDRFQDSRSSRLEARIGLDRRSAKRRAVWQCGFPPAGESSASPCRAASSLPAPNRARPAYRLANRSRIPASSVGSTAPPNGRHAAHHMHHASRRMPLASGCWQRKWTAACRASGSRSQTVARRSVSPANRRAALRQGGNKIITDPEWR